jgi:hypothetical protein
MQVQRKAYKGVAMEGVIATWYARNTGRDARRFLAGAYPSRMRPSTSWPAWPHSRTSPTPSEPSTRSTGC